jgi:hypothetical protein
MQDARRDDVRAAQCHDGNTFSRLTLFLMRVKGAFKFRKVTRSGAVSADPKK